jgi:hypothetical protein
VDGRVKPGHDGIFWTLRPRFKAGVFRARALDSKEFFGSFLQKRTAFLLISQLRIIEPGVAPSVEGAGQAGGEVAFFGFAELAGDFGFGAAAGEQ